MTTTASWATGLTLRSASTLPAGATETHDLDIKDDATIGVSDFVCIQVDIPSTNSSGVTVDFFSSPDGGTTFDTQSLRNGYTTQGSASVRTNSFSMLNYIRVSLTNNDTSNDVSNVAVRYAALKWSP